MTEGLLIVLAVILAFAMIAPGLARRLPPAAATRLLVPACLMMAASGLWALVTMGFTWVAQLGPVSRYGDWSATTIRADSPFPMIVPAGFGLLAIGSVTRAGLLTNRRLRAIKAIKGTCAGHGAAGSLVVLESDRPDAFATPGGASGRIVVTTGLLRALSPAERRALIAHETAHLTHGHVWWLLATDAAAAANPLLLPTASAIEHAVERWADEEAAHQVTDRRLVARTLARAALLIHGGRTAYGLAPTTGGSAPATGGDVPCRVRALLEPPPRPRILPLAVLVALLAAGTVADATVERQGDRLLDTASNVAAAQSPSTHHTRHDVPGAFVRYVVRDAHRLPR